MPKRTNRADEDSPKSEPETRRELGRVIEDLDKTCARARQTIYRLRNLLRALNELEEEGIPEDRRPVRGRFDGSD